MEAQYTCLRCVRALTRSLRTDKKPPAPYVGRRTFSLSAREAQLYKFQSPPVAVRPCKQKRSLASAATARSETSNAANRSPRSSESAYSPPARRFLKENELFHSYPSSPIPEIRQRAAFTRQHAYCPHPDHQQTRDPISPYDPEARKIRTGSTQPPAHVKFTCPDCGIPVYCSEDHWADDYEAHLEICDTLHQINEDDHDLRSGRVFPEFEYPGPQYDEIMVNMTNWDTFLYTRQFNAVNADRSMRQVTRLLTYPITLGSVLHELSPYNLRKGGRLTFEGLKSLTALRYTLHPPRRGAGMDMKGLKVRSPPVRIFILGARAESSLPREVWTQLEYLFPRGMFHIIFIGPESMANRDAEFPLPPRTPANPFGGIVEDRISHQTKITTFVDYFHTLHQANHFYPYDPYFDCFMLYHPGLGHPASAHEWEETLPQLLETKCPVICTGYTDWDMRRDWKWVMERCKGEVDLLMEPGENTFRSLRWDLNDLDPQDISCGNWGVWAFRGKRYEALRKDADPQTMSP